MREGCVERAIVSAGGPKLECDALGFGKVKRIGSTDGEAEKEAPAFTATATKQFVEASPTPRADVVPYVYNGTTEYPDHDPYQPMKWADPTASASMATALQSVSVTVSVVADILPTST